MERRDFYGQTEQFALQVNVAQPSCEVRSHAWLHEIELTWVATNRDGSTTALCRTESQADRLRASLNSSIKR